MTVTEVARNFSSVLNAVASDREEVVLVRNRKPVARLVPEPAEMTALEVLGDLYRTLDHKTSESLANATDNTRKAKRETLNNLRNPGAS